MLYFPDRPPVLRLLNRFKAEKVHIAEVKRQERSGLFSSSAYQWPAYPTAAGADRLVNRGVVVVCSQGNNGPQGLFGGGAPGVGSKVISVGAFENTHVTLPYFELPDGTPVGYRTMTFSVPMPTEGESPEVAYAGLGGVSDFEGLDVEGKVALPG